MNPIPTTNAMKPAPGKGVSSFPTPVIKDTVIVEVVNAWKGDYQPLEYGTKWDDVPHASVQGSYPDHKLISQAPNSEDGQWVKRIWANDRVDQDTYNYAIKYSGGSDQHPIYIRTYILPREGYAPVPDLTPDPLFPGALLVDEEVDRESSELDSRYVKVTRVYETLPGPVIPTQRYNERGDLETVNTQTVAPNTAPDPDGLLVTQSQVVQEEVSKGVKTTATVPSHSQLLIKEKKDGLLGETVTTDDIVAPSTNPDELSTTIVASTVQQISATKAVKRTTTATGPSSLLGGEAKEGLLGNTSISETIVPSGTAPDILSTEVVASRVDPIDSAKSKKTTVVSTGPNSLAQQNKDGKLLGDVTIIESVVSEDANPDEPTGVTSGILSSEVKQVAQGRSIKRNTVLNSTPTLNGSESKSGLLGNTTTQETIVPAGTLAPEPTLNIVASTVEPIDATRSRQVVVTASGPSILSGKQNKDGLLGKTIVTESIVQAGDNPDELSITVLSSEVTPIDEAKSKKTTVESIGPTSLTGTQNKDGLLGKTTVTESIVPTGTQPDPLTFNVLSSEVTPIDSAKAKKTTVVHNGPTVLSEVTLADSPAGLIDAFGQTSIEQTSNVFGGLTVLKNSAQRIDDSKFKRELLQVDSWPELFGVEYDDVLGVPIEYTEKVVDPNEYKNLPSWQDNSNKNYKPIDKWKTMRRTYNKDKIVAAHLEQFYQVESPVKVELPDKLLSVIVYISGQNGGGEETGKSDSVSGTQYEYSISSSYSSSSSRSLDVYFKIESGYSGYVDGYKNIFFAPIRNDGTLQYSVLQYLNQKNAGNGQIIKKWPNIKRISENIVLFGGSNTGTISTSESKSASINGSAQAIRSSSSGSVSSTSNSVQVPTTIHGDIPVQIFADSTTSNQNQSVNSLAYPSVLSATPIPIFPTGIYLIDSNVELYRWGMVKITAITAKITEEYV